MWRSLFLHEFPTDDISDFQAVAGSASQASLSLIPQLQANETRAVRVSPGHGFEYALSASASQVIGISARVRVNYPIQSWFEPVPLVRVGNEAELSLRPIPDESVRLASNATLVLRIGAGQVDLGRLALRNLGFVNLRFDWHASGQARLFVNDRLIGYHPSVAPGAQLAVDGLRFGLPGQVQAPRPAYWVGRVFVRILRRPDALAKLSRMLPPMVVPPAANRRCRARTTSNVLAMVDRLRQFMSLIHQRQSVAWTANGGPARGPFTQAAKRAHDSATTAVLELSRMLRTGDFSAPERFLDPLTAFLQILRETAPHEFSALARELIQAQVVPADCVKSFEATLAEHRGDYDPLMQVLTAASERVRLVAEGRSDG